MPIFLVFNVNCSSIQMAENTTFTSCSDLFVFHLHVVQVSICCLNVRSFDLLGVLPGRWLLFSVVHMATILRLYPKGVRSSFNCIFLSVGWTFRGFVYWASNPAPLPAFGICFTTCLLLFLHLFPPFTTQSYNRSLQSLHAATTNSKLYTQNGSQWS